MTEFKFRIFDNREGLKRMTYPTGFYYYGDGFEGGNPKHKFVHANYPQGAFSTFHVNDIIIMQFTGFLDYEGREIYDQDRIRFRINFSDDGTRAYWSEDGFTGLVYWKDHGWSIKDVVFEKMFDQDYVFSMQSRSFDRDLLERYSKIKIASLSDIGNIELIGFERPDLLK